MSCAGKYACYRCTVGSLVGGRRHGIRGNEMQAMPSPEPRLQVCNTMCRAINNIDRFSGCLLVEVAGLRFLRLGMSRLVLNACITMLHQVSAETLRRQLVC